MASFRWVVCLVFMAVAVAVGQAAEPGDLVIADDHAFASSYARRLHLIGMIPKGFTQDVQERDLATEPGRKKPGLAAIYSLLVPGMGELYAGGFSSGKYFLAAEGVLWLTYAVFEIRGNMMRDDARSYAGVHAGIAPGGKDDEFFVDVGNFANTEEFNEKVLRDRDQDRLYDRAAGYGWQWDSEASRMAYRDQRISSENAYNNRKFVVAAILVNHLGSAINAARSAVSHNNALGQLMHSIDLHAEVAGGTPVFTLSLRTPL